MWKKYIKPYRKEAIIGFVFKLIEAFFELLVPLIVADIIDNGIGKNDTDYIIRQGILMFVLTFVGYGCALVCQYFASKSSQGFGTYLRNDMYKAINAYDYDDIDQIGTPSLITRLSNDVVQLQLAVAMIIRLCSRGPFLIIGSLIMAFRINWQMACIFLVCAPLIALTIYMVMFKSLPLYTKIQKLLDRVSLICRENLSGIRVIRAFSKQHYERKRFHEATRKQKDEQVGVGKIAALLNPFTNLIVNCGIMLVLYIGAIKVNTGTLTQGEVVALINYMNQILLAMLAFANTILILIKASACYKRVEAVLNVQPTIIGGKETEGIHEAPIVTFDHVSFSYHNAKAIEDVSFNIYPGETIGIIGGTGSGKSTLVNMIGRFYEAGSGQIYIKGKPIQDYALDSLRESIGFVPQQAVLFSGTIRKNICWGKQDASDEEMEEALNLAQAQFVFDMKDGIDTYIHQDGHNLSGGQKQRLTIARALVKKPELLILDDSASALDFATDAALRKALATLDQTTIIVSQRVSALMHADKILVLSHGQLVGMGSHDELMNDCQIYQEIVHSQLSKEVA